MPITMHKKTKPVTRSNEDEQNSSSVSFLPKLWSRIPAALILLILLFLWSSSTTLISGSIVNVCVTSRKLNNRLYCFSAGDQTADANIPGPTNTTASTSQKNLAVFTSNVDAPLAIKEEIGLIKSVERPLIATIQLSSTPPSGGGVEKKERVANATQGPAPSSPTTTQLPVANNTSSKDAPGTIGEDAKKSKAVQSLAEGSYDEHLPKEVKEPKNKIISRVSEVKTPVSIIRLPVDGPDFTQKPRKNLVSFVGAPRPKDRDSIRSILIEQCTSAGDKCKFFDCREHRCTKTEAVVESLTESEFCLQPPGDSPTRKSVFDSLVAGCIPVLFDPFTAYYQYPWHLPANQSAYSVFVDQNAVRRREVNVIDRLAAVPADRRAEMRRLIVEEVLPGLVYADPEGKLERFADAFTVAINGVIERMIRLP